MIVSKTRKIKVVCIKAGFTSSFITNKIYNINFIRGDGRCFVRGESCNHYGELLSFLGFTHITNTTNYPLSFELFGKFLILETKKNKIIKIIENNNSFEI